MLQVSRVVVSVRESVGIVEEILRAGQPVGLDGEVTKPVLYREYKCTVSCCTAGRQPGPQGPADPGAGEHSGWPGDHLRCPDHSRPPHPGRAAETSGV